MTDFFILIVLVLIGWYIYKKVKEKQVASQPPQPLSEDQQIDKARNAYKLALDVFNSSEGAEETREAMLLIAKVSDISDRYIYPHLALGKLFNQMNGEKYADDIIRAGEKAYEIDPNNESARNLLALGLWKKSEATFVQDEYAETYYLLKRVFELKGGLFNTDLFKLMRRAAAKADLIQEFTDFSMNDLGVDSMLEMDEGLKNEPVEFQIDIKDPAF